MGPGEYNISVYQGDTFSDIDKITIPDLSSRLGPADLTGDVEVSAQIRLKADSEETIAEFDIEVLDESAREIRPTIPAAETAGIAVKKGFWDLQVRDGDWVGTILKGKVTFTREVTR